MFRLITTVFVALVSVTAIRGPTAALPPAWEDDEDPPAIRDLLAGRFAWTTGAPLVSPADRPEDPCRGIKDPSIVQFDGKWHLFCTIRSEKRSHQIEYLSFTDWKDADKAPRHILKISDSYFCAPQVFYFEPHKKWYLIYQIEDLSRKPDTQPAFSTNDDITNPNSWTKPTMLFPQQPKNVRAWIDFWVICDDMRAYLFFTSPDGRLWRSQTRLEDFPKNWTQPLSCLEHDIFEASHTYKLKGLHKYLTLIEAIGDNGRRYYKAFISDYLNGGWEELASTKKQPFASRDNVRQNSERWIDSVSHGELLRDGYNQELEVDPMHLRFLFQGVSDGEKAGRAYGNIPWRLGILEPVQ